MGFVEKIWTASRMSFIKEAINNDRGFFQGGKSFGGKGFLGQGGVLGDLTKKLKPKPYAGIPGVCPYSGKPLDQPGVAQKCAATAQAQGEEPPPELSQLRQGALTGRKTMPLGAGFVDTSSPFVQQQLRDGGYM